ncbi:hypothetical protein KJ853_00625 [Patescibacteria group bacterium]|nr:hypothetical protein [Patescibacteria group bacterium]
MPYSMPFGGQDDKWFSILIIISLPLYLFYKIVKNDLPPLSQAGPEKK